MSSLQSTLFHQYAKLVLPQPDLFLCSLVLCCSAPDYPGMYRTCPADPTEHWPTGNSNCCSCCTGSWWPHHCVCCYLFHLEEEPERCLELCPASIPQESGHDDYLFQQKDGGCPYANSSVQQVIELLLCSLYTDQ